jgi:chromosome segregation protein
MLQQLELFGFKSFADRTTFDFVPGITCVVGPNGSGKSNVVDAIKWILGDQSAKSLRGKEMADVIFNGSAGRKSSGFAEATLTFDNSTGLLQVDAAQVRVGRRLYRTGESEYLLNGVVVRLKDVRDAFLGTGAGTSAYSIIEQGRVDQILQANPTTRRIVFEEAAGISRYRNRKLDAERKLERVAQNLARLNDIVREVESQLLATRNQASKAARYRDLAQELRVLWTGLAADDYRQFRVELVAAEGEAADHERQLSELNARLVGLEGAKVEVEAALARADQVWHGLQRQVSANRESIAARESTIRHLTTRQRELEADVAELRAERLRIGVRARTTACELQETSDRLLRFEQALAAQRQTLHARESLLAGLQGQAEQARGEAAQLRRQQADFATARTEQAGRTTLLAARAAASQSAIEAALQQRDALAEAIRQAEALRDVRAETVSAAQLAHGQAVADVERMQRERLRLLDEQGHSEKSLTAMRDQRVAWDARILVLEDLERRQEGLGLGVREILHRATERSAAPWDRVVGCVGELLDVPLEHAALLEVALGQRAQMLVTSDLQSVVDYLNRRDGLIAGRVGFLEMIPSSTALSETLPWLEPNPNLSRDPGVVARADQLAQEPDQVRGLAARLLSNTWIVETLEVARRLVEHGGGQVRCVTLQGELVEADGALYAGTVPNEISVVSRKSELRRLRSDLHELDGEIAEQLRELTALGQNLTSVDDELACAEYRRHQTADQLSAARLELASQDRELERLTAEQERANAALAELMREYAAIDEELAQARTLAAECQTRIAETEAAAAVAERELADIERTLHEVREETKREQLELAKHEERGVALRDAQQRLEREQTHRMQQLQQAAERLRSVEQARRSARLQVLNTQTVVADLFARAEQLDTDLVRADAEGSALRARRSAVHRSEDELHTLRRHLSDADHVCELRIRELRHQLATLEARIEEEYQLKLPDLVAEGVSAYARWQTQAAGGVAGSGDNEAHTHHAAESADPGTWHGTRHETGPGSAEALASDPSRTFLEIRAEMEEEVHRLHRKLKTMGHVNTEALESLDELESRFTRLSGQLQDLTEAKSALEEIIRRINGESRRMFLDTFESIRGHFRELFRKLFGGGEADIVLEDPNDVLECGIDIVARPPGKELRSITLLSGGEKTLTAIALLFAMFKSKPSPYCVLDEVDAALDEANVERYATILKDFVQMTQFVVITHRKRTMTAADVIYGVTMEQAGVSKRMSVRFEEVAENGEIRTRGGRAA